MLENNKSQMTEHSYESRRITFSNNAIEIEHKGSPVNGREKFLIISLRCSKTGKDFLIHLKRREVDGLYIIDKIFTKEDFSKLDSDFESEKIEINADKIEWRNSICPYCKGKGIYSCIQCGCGKLSCDGGLKKKHGKYLFTCPWCGMTDYVSEEPFEVVEGEEVAKEINTQKQISLSSKLLMISNKK